MTTTLTDRYVAATLRRLPARQRADINTELRGLIADAVDGREASGATPADAEVQALTELGDPARLAAQYSERPLHLIGPRLFLDYSRLLIIALSTVVPLVLVVVAFVAIQGGSDFLSAARDAVVASAVVAFHIAFWSTALFAVLERLPALSSRRTQQWNPLARAALPERGLDAATLIGGSSVAAVIATALVVLQTVGPVRYPDGSPIGLIEPGLWNSGALLLAGLFMVASIGAAFAGHYVGWGYPQALANAVLALLFSVPVIVLALSGALLNPAFFTATGWPDGDGVVAWIIVVFIGLLSFTDIVDGFARARRAN